MSYLEPIHSFVSNTNLFDENNKLIGQVPCICFVCSGNDGNLHHLATIFKNYNGLIVVKIIASVTTDILEKQIIPKMKLFEKQILSKNINELKIDCSLGECKICKPLQVKK